MIGNVAFTGHKIYENMKILQEPLTVKTTPEEDRTDFDKIMKDLNETKPSNIKTYRENELGKPELLTDKYRISTRSNDQFERADRIFVTNLKEKITNVFYHNSPDAGVKKLFGACVQFLKDNIKI